MTKLTTHVLDIYSGKPGKGIKVDLFYINGDDVELEFKESKNQVKKIALFRLNELFTK